MEWNRGENSRKEIHKSHFQRMVMVLAVILLLFSQFPMKVSASETKPDYGTRIVRVGYFIVEGFQEYDEETGVYSGYGYEFLMAIAAYANWQYEFVLCDTFPEALELLQKGEIDLINDVGKVEGREIEYSQLNAGDGCSYLLMHSDDNRVAYNDWEGISKITIGVDKEAAFNNQLFDILKEHGVSPNLVWYENELALFAAWENGEVDACVAMSDTAMEGNAIMVFEPRMYYLATTKGNTEFINEVDLAIQALRANAPNFEPTLYDKYYNKVSRNYSALTTEEQQYVKENPVVRVLYVPDWYPMSYQDEKGEFSGPFRKIYELLEQRTGLQFEFVPMDYDIPFEGITETYNCYMLAEHPADYTGAATYNVKLTQTFVNAALVEVTKGTLNPGDTLALVEGDCLSEVVKRLFGNEFQYSMENSIEDCVEKVHNGTVDGTVLMSYEAEYYQSLRENRNLIFTVVNSGSYGFGLAVSNEANPLLYSIIVKGLNAIDEGEVSNIFNQMTQALKKTTLWDTILDNPVPFAVGGFCFAAILVFFICGLFFSRKIKEKNDELVRANVAKTQFFSRMSHDMRTPMNGILGIAELSKDDKDAETLHGEMKKIEQSGKYLLSLINDSLDFQRIESGNLKLENEMVNFQGVFQNIVELVEPTAKGKAMNFQILGQKNIPDGYVWADPVRLKQIFINLLSNAIKFTPSGGTVTMEYECRKQEGGRIWNRYYIRDTGVGMSQDFMDNQMFQPFHQEHNEVTGQYTGSGLGLSIVKCLVDLMQGTIHVESTPGHGTTFIVDLDFEKASAEDVKQMKLSQKENSGIHEECLKGVKVLLAEDHPLNAEIAIRLLHRVGCEVEWAKNGQEAVSVYSKSADHYFNIILMDIRMPIMDGLEATRHIRALTREDAKTIPIIAMTANAYESNIKECLDVGMNEHVSKPIDPQKLYQTLAKEIKK